MISRCPATRYALFVPFFATGKMNDKNNTKPQVGRVEMAGDETRDELRKRKTDAAQSGGCPVAQELPPLGAGLRLSICFRSACCWDSRMQVEFLCLLWAAFWSPCRFLCDNSIFAFTGSMHSQRMPRLGDAWATKGSFHRMVLAPRSPLINGAAM